MTDEDRRLQQLVLEELAWDPSLGAAAIGAIADGGVVTLSGQVPSYLHKLAAECAALRVRGVKAVAQDIEVRLPAAARLADAEIADRARRVLGWDAALPPDSVQVAVEAGWVTLTGEVAWQFQRAAAEAAVQRLAGVAGLANQLSLRGGAQPADLRERIRQALLRDGRIEAAAIGIILQGGRVELTGRVRSSQERVAVLRAAWSAPGVTELRDRLLVA